MAHSVQHTKHLAYANQHRWTFQFIC